MCIISHRNLFGKAFPTSVAVWGYSPPANTTMALWADTAGNNNLVNVTDVAFLLLVFQRRFDAARQIDKISSDLVTGAGPCFADPEIINVADLQRLWLAFKRQTYEEAVTTTSGATGCAMPCP